VAEPTAAVTYHKTRESKIAADKKMVMGTVDAGLASLDSELRPFHNPTDVIRIMHHRLADWLATTFASAIPAV